MATAQPPWLFPLAGWKLAATGDFNADGTTGLLWQNGNGVVSDWLMRDGKPAATFQVSTLASGTQVLTAGDFNGDGTTDVLLQNSAGALSVWVMDLAKRVATVQILTLKGWQLPAYR